jgi:hypothetical protein
MEQPCRIRSLEMEVMEDAAGIAGRYSRTAGGVFAALPPGLFPLRTGQNAEKHRGGICQPGREQTPQVPRPELEVTAEPVAEVTNGAS